MPTLAELSAKVDELQTSLDEEQQQVANKIAELEAIAAELRTTGGTDADRQAVADKIDAVAADLKATIPDDVVPEPPAPEE
jgi:Tfp pilus assembly protein FimV